MADLFRNNGCANATAQLPPHQVIATSAGALRVQPYGHVPSGGAPDLSRRGRARLWPSWLRQLYPIFKCEDGSVEDAGKVLQLLHLI